MKSLVARVRRWAEKLIARRTRSSIALAVIIAPKISMGMLTAIELYELRSGALGRTRRKTLLRIAGWWALCIIIQVVWPALIALAIFAWRREGS